MTIKVRHGGTVYVVTSDAEHRELDIQPQPKNLDDTLRILYLAAEIEETENARVEIGEGYMN